MSYTIGKTTNAELELKTSTGDIELSPYGDVTINGDLTVDGEIMSNSPKRSEFERVEYSTNSTTYVQYVNRLGSGKLYWLVASSNSSQTDTDFRITIDGLVSTLTLESIGFVVPKSNGSTSAAWFKGLPMADQHGSMVMGIDYQDSLVIEVKSSTGLASVWFKCAYSVD